MDEPALRAALREAVVPDGADARLRARAVVLAAHARREGRARPSRRWRAGIAAVAVLAVGAAGAVSGPAAVARWMGTTLRLSPAPPGPRRAAPPRATPPALPGGGRLLVAGADRAWLAGGGRARAVGALPGQLSWSAFGHYLAQAHGTMLRAVDLRGHVRWSQTYPAAVRDPRWSPDGNRLALRVGTQLRITAGDGTGAHALARGVAPVAPAWRPGGGHELAVVTAGGPVALLDADRGTRLATLRVPAATRSLSWAADGGRLLAIGAREARIVTVGGTTTWRRRGAFTGGQLSADGRRVALTDPARALLVTVSGGTRTLLAARALPAPLFSPDGRWLLVDWRRGGSWLFFATAPGDRRVRQVARLDGAVGGWCCARAR
jgi:dipeptidyl aminopeptidase/acylaminoacyl peptidase